MKARQSRYAKELFKDESRGRKILRKIRRDSSNGKYVPKQISVEDSKNIRVKEL
ncbi:MAG: hypothetical protein KGY69_10665 [Bacteroidales bacterium]|nr:hypothetical protein [Bacteroidales bacterium]